MKFYKNVVVCLLKWTEIDLDRSNHQQRIKSTLKKHVYVSLRISLAK